PSPSPCTPVIQTRLRRSIPKRTARGAPVLRAWAVPVVRVSKYMSTESQIEANRENAKLSTGPKSEAGKAAAALNNTRHGLAGAFRVLPTESQSDFDALLATLTDEHQPATFTETTLVEAMAQHHWLRTRSL